MSKPLRHDTSVSKLSSVPWLKSLLERNSMFFFFYPWMNWQRDLAWLSPSAILIHIQQKELRQYTEHAPSRQLNRSCGVTHKQGLAECYAASLSGLKNIQGQSAVETEMSWLQLLTTAPRQAWRTFSKTYVPPNEVIKSSPKCTSSSVYVSYLYAWSHHLHPDLTAHWSQNSMAWFCPCSARWQPFVEKPVWHRPFSAFIYTQTLKKRWWLSCLVCSHTASPAKWNVRSILV